MPVAAIVPENAGADLSDKPIGTGPWMLDKFEPKVSSSWVRNPDYVLKPLPYFYGLQDIVVTDTSATIAAFRSGQLSASDFNMNPGSAKQLQGTKKRWWSWCRRCPRWRRRPRNAAS